MKYAHLADLHLGSWREQKMRDLSTNAFLMAIDKCVAKEVDFILFAGDLFNTSLPSLDTLKIVTKKLKELKDQNIPIYVIAGSHDFSPSGKTMVDVLENAGLLQNVCKGKINEEKKLELKFTIDPKTGVKMTGILGRKGQLDRTFYEDLARESLENEDGYKIFMFHTTVSEMKPKHLEKVESHPASFLPKNFNYYAGGHIHHPTKIELEGYGTLTYPGALFPNNFAEVEKYSHGGFYVVETNTRNNNNELNQEVKWIPLKVIEHIHKNINCHLLTPEQIGIELRNFVQNIEVDKKLVTLRLVGQVKGKISDIPFNEIVQSLHNKGAYFVMKNSAKLQNKEFEEIRISNQEPEVIEQNIIEEHLQQMQVFSKEIELQTITTLFKSLNTTKKEGETNTDFHYRIEQEVDSILNIK